MLVSGPGSRFLRAAPRGVVAARRGEVSLASCSGGCFLRAAPRGGLRWRGAHGALRPLFVLRSRAADQEKRPEKKSWAVMACASVRLERLGGTCIRSAPRCISRGQRERRILLAAWERDLEKNCGSWVCGACAVRWGFVCERPRKPLPSRRAARDTGGCAAGRSFAGELQRRVFPPLCAARGTALSRSLLGAAAAFLASLTRR